ncbi:MAG: transporter substrate-binding protein [Proteobacteria bacterium]|nr:transporter substrate-binding protein [Pseudomonadota bacterium]
MKTTTTCLAIGNWLTVLLLSLAIAQPSFATAPRFSAAKLAEEAKPHLVAYEYPPLVTGNETEPGAAIELARKAFEVMGKQVSVEVVPAKSFAMQLLTDDVKVLGMFAEARLLAAAERKALVEEKCLSLTGRYYYYRPVRGKELAAVRDLKALKGKTYGAVPGEATETYAKAGIKVSVGEPKLMLRKLQTGEIDFLSAFEPAGDWNIDKLFAGERDNFAKLPMTAWETTFSLWFNSSHPGAQEWRQTFAEGLKKLRHNGAYLEILKKYKLEPWAIKP